MVLNLELLKRILTDVFHSPIDSIKLDPLPGDASDRRYYRISWHEKTSERTCILMAMADSEGARTSEEAGSDSFSGTRELPFINIQRHLRACKVSVPQIFAYDEEKGWLFLEDLGDLSFSERTKGHLKDHAILLDYYRRGIDALITIQAEATPVLNQPSIAHYRCFDQDLFAWEFDHFIKYGIEARNGTVLPDNKKKALQNSFSGLALQLSALPKVFVHRDYHGRNLMVQSKPTGFKIRIIDFQDALMGPAQYDLASLLRDAYIDLPEAVVDELFSYYIEKWEECSGALIDKSVFRESFDLISLQRNLKAAGRFVYIDQVKQKNHLLKYVAPSLVKARRNLTKYPQLKQLHALLATEVEELR